MTSVLTNALELNEQNITALSIGTNTLIMILYLYKMVKVAVHILLAI